MCLASGMTPIEDPSNDDRRFTRNRVRHELLPLLASISGRDPVPVLVRQSELLGGEAELLDDLAAALDPTDARALAAAPEALARRALRTWLRPSDVERHPPSAAEVARVLQVVRGEAVACELAGGRRVQRSGGRLHLLRPDRLPARGGSEQQVEHLGVQRALGPVEGSTGGVAEGGETGQ